MNNPNEALGKMAPERSRRKTRMQAAASKTQAPPMQSTNTSMQFHGFDMNPQPTVMDFQTMPMQQPLAPGPINPTWAIQQFPQSEPLSLQSETEIAQRIEQLESSNAALNSELSLHKSKIQQLEQQMFMFYGKIAQLEDSNFPDYGNEFTKTPF